MLTKTASLTARSITAAALFILGWCSISAAQSKELPVDEIVNQANRASYYQGRDGRAQVKMVITDSQGRERQRQFTILRRDQQPAEDTTDQTCANQHFYVYFHRPADVNKTVFMVWKNIDKDDDRWMYLPALDLVKRIAASDKRTSFVGSDFFYEDVSGRSTTEDIHELTDTTDNYYVLNNTPKNPNSVEFSRFTMWIHRATFIPVKIEYFDKQGEKYREYAATKVENISGFPTVMAAEMKDLRTNSKTVMTYAKVEYNIGLPEEIFTERYLRNPPQKYLR